MSDDDSVDPHLAQYPRQMRNIDQSGFPYDVNVNRFRSNQQNGRRSVRSGIRDRCYPAVLIYADGAQGKLDCVGSVCQADALSSPAIGGKFFLKCLAFTPKYVTPAGNNAIYCMLNLGKHRVVFPRWNI